MNFCLEENNKQFQGTLEYLGPQASTDPELNATETDYLNPDFILKVLQYRARRHVFAASDAFEKDLSSGECWTTEIELFIDFPYNMGEIAFHTPAPLTHTHTHPKPPPPPLDQKHTEKHPQFSPKRLYSQIQTVRVGMCQLLFMRSTIL